jgi:acyl-[acyl carrier protein]--UDP-N-acetylglucosamine O-acyltransferase
MLLHYDYNKPIYVVGDGLYTQELVEYLLLDTMNVRPVSTEEYFVLPDNSQCLIGFHNMEYRIRFLNDSSHLKRCWPSFIHPNGTISKSATFGKGVTIGPMNYVGYGAVVADFCSTGPFVHIGHGANLGNNCIVNQFSAIGGSTVVGNNVEIGQSSTIKDKIKICSDVQICMTSAVTKTIGESGKYFGNRRVSIDSDK